MVPYKIIRFWAIVVPVPMYLAGSRISFSWGFVCRDCPEKSVGKKAMRELEQDGRWGLIPIFVWETNVVGF